LLIARVGYTQYSNYHDAGDQYACKIFAHGVSIRYLQR
jgi:hypothetical protein